jgi:hypothetical protein
MMNARWKQMSPSIAWCAGVVALAFPVTLAAFGCDDTPTHVYSAELYEQASDCLDDYVALDIVSGGSGSALCDPVCLVNGTTYYVSRMCAPYPSAVTPGDATDPTCTAALAAYTNCKFCQNTGNEPTCTAPEGGADEASADDASTDEAGGDEASTD